MKNIYPHENEYIYIYKEADHHEKKVFMKAVFLELYICMYTLDLHIDICIKQEFIRSRN